MEHRGILEEVREDTPATVILAAGQRVKVWQHKRPIAHSSEGERGGKGTHLTAKRALPRRRSYRVGEVLLISRGSLAALLAVIACPDKRLPHQKALRSNTVDPIAVYQHARGAIG